MSASSSQPLRSLWGLLLLAGLSLSSPAPMAGGGGPPPPTGCLGGRSAPDVDGDGVPGDADACPDAPEDPDGFEDLDGCPDKDNDQDGLPDASDPCPNTAEDLDGVLDGDGCPDLDGTVVLVLSTPGGEAIPAVSLDARPLFGQEQPDPPKQQRLSFPPGAPVRAELSAGLWGLRARVEGYADYSLNVTVPDGAELTVNIALQPVGGLSQLLLDVRDPQGRPVAGAELTVAEGAAPIPSVRGMIEAMLPAGPTRMVIQAPGYNDAVRELDLIAGEVRDMQVALTPLPLVAQRGDFLVLRDPITFRPGTDSLSPESFASVDALAKWLLEHPEASLLRVEAHTDGLGDIEQQQRLSQRQAEAIVNALEDRGVPQTSLYALGFGGAVPLDTSSNEQGRAKNRRVELVLERGGGGLQ